MNILTQIILGETVTLITGRILYMNIRSVNDERSRWLRALQRGVITQEIYDSIIDRLDEVEAHLTMRATDPLMAVGESESFSKSAATLWQSLQA